MSNFALANPGTLGSSLQEFFELRSKTEAPQQSQKTRFSALYSAFAFFEILTQRHIRSISLLDSLN